MKRLSLLTALLMALCATADAQIYRVAQMNTEQIRALDEQKTVVILTGGILEEQSRATPARCSGTRR